MDQKRTRTVFGQPTPELPVEDVERAQQHYRDALGFEISWLESGGNIGAVSRDDISIFFRRRERPFEPAVHWIFAAEIDATYEEMRSLGARIVEPLDQKPWGLRQFTVEDLDGNRFYFHCDGAAGNPAATANLDAESVVREFWRLMATNDFDAVRSVLAPEFVLEWPQSKERIRGGENFARMNAEYPASGRWQFRINRLVASGDTVVTQVSVTDGVQSAEPISFFTIAAGRITHLLEYWPEPFVAPENRRHLTEPM